MVTLCVPIGVGERGIGGSTAPLLNLGIGDNPIFSLNYMHKLFDNNLFT